MTQTQMSVMARLSDQLRRDISLGILPPGAKLNIEGIKRQFKVSHASVREALSLLLGEGYVASEGQKGFYVLESSQEEQQDITRVRAELECLAFDWSIRNADTDFRASIVAAHYALTEVESDMLSDPVSFALEWDERNRKFHFALIGNCGSPVLLDLISTQYDLSRRYRLMAHGQSRGKAEHAMWIEKSSHEHRKLMQSALEANVEGGKALLREHIIKAQALHRGVVVSLAKT